MPPPTGVVSGPLMPTTYSSKAAMVSSGSHEPVSSNAFWPARTSIHSIAPAVAGDGGVEDGLGGGPDVDADAVAPDERHDGLVGDVQGPVVGDGDVLGHDRQSLDRR